MTQSTETVVKRYLKASRRLRREAARSPTKAKAFLLRAGIAERSKVSTTGVRLAKRFR